jgi:hypothetical protein
MFGEINAIRALATKYSKTQLANLVQTGQIEPQKAVMAGMMIDRIAKSAMEPPQTTVAQDVLGPAPTAGQMPPDQMQQGQPPQMPPPQMAAHGGLMGMLPQSSGVSALHSGLHDMAGGGIVAFADGGDVPSFAGNKGSYVDDDLFKSVIAAESRGNPNAVSPKGARGLAQLMPGTSRDPGFGVQAARDESPEENKRVGKDYLNAMLKRYGNMDYALAAYNWGPGNTDKWIARGAKPEELPAETRAYIPKVKAGMAQMQAKAPVPGGEQLAGIADLIPSAQAAEPQRSPSGPAMAKAEASKAAAPKTQEESDREAIMGGVDKLGAAAKDVLSLPGRLAGKAVDTAITRPLRAFGVNIPYLPKEFYGGEGDFSISPYMDAIEKKEQSTAALPPIAKPSAKTTAAKPQDTTTNTLNPKAEAAAEEKPAMGPERPSIMDRVMGNITPTELEKPAQKTIQTVAQEQKDADKLYGVDTAKMFDDLRQDYKKSSGNLKDRSEKAAGMAFMMFGAGLMGAKKGRVGEALSKSGQQALGTYMGAMDKINDNEDKLNQRMQDLTMAENQFNRSRSDKALAEVQANKRDIQAIEAENNRLKNHAMIEGAKMTVDWFKNNNPPAYQYLQRIVEAKHASGDKSYTITDALHDEKTGGAKGVVTDKELQASFESRRKEAAELGGTKLKEFDKQYPTWQHFAAKEGRSGSRSVSGETTTSGVVVQTPQGSVRFNTQAEADAYKKRVGLQ